jgi:hypothetical protein
MFPSTAWADMRRIPSVVQCRLFLVMRDCIASPPRCDYKLLQRQNAPRRSTWLRRAPRIGQIGLRLLITSTSSRPALQRWRVCYLRNSVDGLTRSGNWTPDLFRLNSPALAGS